MKITHPLLVHVTIDRTADDCLTVWQVFGDLWTRINNQNRCYNIRYQKSIVYLQFPNTCWCKSSHPKRYTGLIHPVRAIKPHIRLAVCYRPWWFGYSKTHHKCTASLRSTRAAIARRSTTRETVLVLPPARGSSFRLAFGPASPIFVHPRRRIDRRNYKTITIHR